MIQYRELRAKDNAAIADIIFKSLEEYDLAIEGTVYTDPETRELSSIFTQDASKYFVATDGEVIVGGGGIYPTRGLPEDTVELVKMYVDSKFRGKGIGKQLIQLCLTAARDAGYKKIYLESFPELVPAIQLYRSFGFKVCKDRQGVSGHYSCNVFMILDL